jgi:omega-amidase
VIAVSPARNPSAGYQAWGHSSVINPWGEVIATTGHEEAIIYANLDMEQLQHVRSNIPTSQQKRGDIYELVDKKP